jgi:hypothetical protein
MVSERGQPGTNGADQSDWNFVVVDVIDLASESI